MPLGRLSKRTIDRIRPSRVALRSSSTSTDVAITDPLILYFSLVAQEKIKKDDEQLRALVQIRKLHEQLLDYQPPIRLLTLLESIRDLSPRVPPSSTATTSTLSSALAAWPFKRSSHSELGQELLPHEVEERTRLLALSDKEKTTQLVRVLKAHEGLEDLDTPRGFLLTGPPGTGKSLLMDLFFQSLPVPHKVRFHYHAFLLSVYQSVHQALERQRRDNEDEERRMNETFRSGAKGGYPWTRREEMKARALTQGWQSVFAGGRSASDPGLNTKEFVLAKVALELITKHGWLLAFDEVQLVDIAGAGLVSRVMSWYWRLGGVVVATSNRVPEDLYKQGIQRSTLSPFLSALSHRSPVIELVSPNDYRLVARSQRPLTPETDAASPGSFGDVDAWKRWGTRSRAWFIKGEEKEYENALDWVIGPSSTRGDAPSEPRELSVYGRKLRVPWSRGGVARFSFKDLCEKALGPADYITLGSEFHTIIIDKVPILPLNAKNEARRLITLLDALYETKTRLLALAEAPIDSLFFPDAVKGAARPRPEELDASVPELGPPAGSQAPGSGGPIHVLDQDTFSLPLHSSLGAATRPASLDRYAGHDAAGEVVDSLTQEMIGDVAQDLDSPYRPNISSYSESRTVGAYEREQQPPPRATPPPTKTKTRPAAPIHPSAATPSFQSLAIFTGEEERFAFKRAVSRLFEMNSPEYLVTAVHTPLPASVRSWERTPETDSDDDTAIARPMTPAARHSIGEKEPLPVGPEDKLSGVLDPNDLRHRWPQGLPRAGKEVDVNRLRSATTTTTTAQDDDDNEVEVQQSESKKKRPVRPLSEEHFWGAREDWGPKAGTWGQGAKAYRKP